MNSKPLNESEERNFRCHICVLKGLSKAQLKQHLLVHGDLLTCDICCKTFEKQEELVDHRQCHFGTIFKCTQCTSIFKTASELKTHGIVHEAKYVCAICYQGFGDLQVYNRHLKVHKNFDCYDLRYKCTKCRNVSFKTKAELEKHVSSHETEKAYICGICKKGFEHSWEYSRHCDVHKHPCLTCGERFASLGELECHVITHKPGFKKGKRFTCIPCGESFQHESECAQHKCSKDNNSDILDQYDLNDSSNIQDDSEDSSDTDILDDSGDSSDSPVVVQTEMNMGASSNSLNVLAYDDICNSEDEVEF